jgi:hypothetical protein
VKPAEFRQFNNTTVPLVRLHDRVLTNDMPFHVEAELAHYGPKPLASISPHWRILDESGKRVASGSLPVRSAPRGKNISLGTITADLTKLPAPAAYTLELELAGTLFRNTWNFWLYPSQGEVNVPAGVTISESWDEARAVLRRGGRVLYLSGLQDKPSADLALTTVPIFWNRLMNPSRAWMLGLLCDVKHPALKSFPTNVNCDWQWTDLLPKTTALNIDGLTHELKPIVQPIDDWNRNLRLAMLFECSVGSGRLMVTSLDLSEAGMAGHPGAPALRRSVLEYMASDAFKPASRIALTELDAWVPKRYTPPAGIVKPEGVVDPGQIRRQH